MAILRSGVVMAVKADDRRRVFEDDSCSGRAEPQSLEPLRKGVSPETVSVLRRLQPSTLKAGGPFIGMEPKIDDTWAAIVTAAKVEPITIHDLRRTFVTRLVRAGVPLPTAQKLAGHQSITTTLKYYNAVGDEDKRAGIEKPRRAQGG